MGLRHSGAGGVRPTHRRSRVQVDGSVCESDPVKDYSSGVKRWMEQEKEAQVGGPKPSSLYGICL